MKIELKNIRHAEFASQETDCFEASVYIDGKREGTVENQGHGGCNFYRPPALGDRIEAYAKTLPPEPVEISPGRVEMLPQSADTLIGRIFGTEMARRHLQRALKRRLVFRDAADGKLYQTKTLPEARIRTILAAPRETLLVTYKASVILNLLTLDDAVAEYRRKPEPAAAAA